MSVNNLFPEFGYFSFFEKLELGFFSTFYEVLVKPKILFFVFSLAIIVCIFSKTENLAKFFALTSPLIALLILNFFRGILLKNFPKQEDLWRIVKTYRSKTFFSINVNLVLDFLFFLAILYIVFLLLRCFEVKFNFFVSIGILFVGFLTRMVMSFSPSIFISGERTFLFFYFSIISVIMLMRKEVLGSSCKNIFCCLILLSAFVTPFSMSLPA